MDGVFSNTAVIREGESISQSSEKVFYAGSLWSLDVKRYRNAGDGLEYAAVYLRRRSPRVRSGA